MFSGVGAVEDCIKVITPLLKSDGLQEIKRYVESVASHCGVNQRRSENSQLDLALSNNLKDIEFVFNKERELLCANHYRTLIETHKKMHHEFWNEKS